MNGISSPVYNKLTGLLLTYYPSRKVPKDRTQYNTLVVLSGVSGGLNAKVWGCQPKAHNIRILTLTNFTKEERGIITGPCLTPNHN